MYEIGYWKWLYNAIMDIKRDQLIEIWWYVRVIGVILIFLGTITTVFFYFFENDAIAFILTMIFGLFFSLTWFVYNVNK